MRWKLNGVCALVPGVSEKMTGEDADPFPAFRAFELLQRTHDRCVNIGQIMHTKGLLRHRAGR